MSEDEAPEPIPVEASERQFYCEAVEIGNGFFFKIGEKAFCIQSDGNAMKAFDRTLEALREAFQGYLLAGADEGNPQ